ncbi:MAG: ABC transporter ATP-binding protein [Woeseiaceae bacterium]|nr:ABC transporter ATP-binding protein [Woeseiaceae bacterium]
MTSTAQLHAESLTVSVPGRTLIEALDLSLHAGEFLAVLGQNGSGKSLCMMTLCGLRPAAGGRVLLSDQPIDSIDRAAIARKLSLLPQISEDIFPSTVLDTALIGRYPHIGRYSWESPQDRSIALRSLQIVDLEGLADRDVLTLSGGERQRLAVAQVLTQQPDIFLLDEPTNHLDPQHQIDVMRVFRQRADDGACVAAALHDVNLASRFADRCLLLFGDGRWRLGKCDDVLEESTLTELYGTPMERVQWRENSLFIATAS